MKWVLLEKAERWGPIDPDDSSFELLSLFEGISWISSYFPSLEEPSFKHHFLMLNKVGEPAQGVCRAPSLSLNGTSIIMVMLRRKVHIG